MTPNAFTTGTSLLPKDDGWLPHNCGPCPVPGETVVEREYDDKSKDDEPTKAEYSNWAHVIRYRIITPAPDPLAEVKAAHKARKVVQVKGMVSWFDIADPTWTFPYDQYRIKPSPSMVPLEPQDVPPGSVFRHDAWAKAWLAPISARDNGVEFANDAGWQTYFGLREAYLINRSLPLTGRWNATAWEPCEKPDDKLS